MSNQEMPWERAGMNAAWYENQPFDIGARVVIDDPDECERHSATAGRVVGYDASGPRPGERFVRVLIQLDSIPPVIVAIPPAALKPEPGGELHGIAATLLAGLEQSLRPEQFQSLLAWLNGDKCREFIAAPDIRMQRIRLGEIYLPGILLPELADLARARLEP